MEIKRVQIKYFKKDGFESDSHENVKHVKILPYLSVVQSVEGSYDIALGNGRTMQTGDGGFFVAPSGIQQTIVHHVNPQSGRMKCRWLFIDVEINDAYALDALYQFPVILRDEFKGKMNDLFDALFSTDDFWETHSCCYQILGLLLQGAEPLQNKINHGVLKAVEYMTKNYAQAISIAELSKVSNMSQSNFYAVFRKHFGCSPIAYLNHYRLSLAASLMMETEAMIGEIAYSVGVSDPLYFSKLFKKTYGLSPKEYRALYRTV